MCTKEIRHLVHIGIVISNLWDLLKDSWFQLEQCR